MAVGAGPRPQRVRELAARPAGAYVDGLGRGTDTPTRGHPMRHLFPVFALLLLAAASPSKTRMPKPELAGIKLGMEAEAARGQLGKHGTPVPSKDQEHEGGEQQSWSIKHGPWGYVALGFQ